MAPDFSSVQKVLSGRWTLNVLLAAESGGRFGELQGRLGPIARGTLSKELQTLTELELITKTVYSEFPPRVEYQLTERGKSLTPLLRPLASDPSACSAGASPAQCLPHW